MTPTSTPLRELVDRLSAVAGWDAETIWEQIGRDPLRVVEAIRALLVERADRGDRRGARLVLVVDQLEELFTSCPDRHERDQFIAALAASVDSAGDEPVALVILGLRSDFYGHAAEYPELRSALQDGQVLVGPMTSDELTATIRKPAEAVGLGVEPGLVELLVRDVGVAESAMRQDAALPLLAHALSQTWGFRDGRTLTVDGYLRTGGVSGALAKTAEEMYTKLDATGQRTAEALLIRLIQLGETTRDTRRRVDIPALCAGLPDAHRVLEALTGARLVTIDRNVVRITHEALLVAWDRLRRALVTDRWRLVEVQKLDAEADRWERAGRDPSFLLRGSRLTTARDLLARLNGSARLTPVAEALLTGSIAQETAAEHGARRRIRFARSLVAIAVVLVLLTVTAVLWGVAAYRAEQQRLRVAASLQAAATSIALRATQPTEAMLLAVAAWRIAPTTEARGALLSTQSQPFAGVLSAHRGRADPAVALAVHPASRHVAAARQRAIELWTISRGQRRLVAELATPGPVTTLAFTADGTKLMGIDQAGIHIWDAQTGAPQGGLFPMFSGVQKKIAVDPSTGAIAIAINNAIQWIEPGTRSVTRTWSTGLNNLMYLAYTGDGRILTAVPEQAARIVLLDPATGAVRATIGAGSARITGLAVQPNGPLVATASGDGIVRLWDPTTTSVAATVNSQGGVATALAFSSDGRQLATAGSDQAIRLWDVRTGKQIGEPLTAHSGPITALTFGPDDTLISAGADVIVWDLTHRPKPAHAGPANAVVFRSSGRQLATVGDDGAVHLWDVARRALVSTLVGHTGSVRAAAFNAPGTLLATGGDDNTVRTWNVETGKQIGPALDSPPPGVRAVAFSPDGTMLAAATEGPTLRLWQANRPTPRDLAIGDDVNGQYRMSFTPDNAKLIVTGRDVTVHYDARSGSRIGQPQRIHGPPSAAPAIEAGDGSIKVTVDDDQFVRLWDAGNRLQATLYGHHDTVLDAALSDDRHTLATVSRDGALMIWDINPDRVAIETCEVLGELSADQWRNYITDLPYQSVCGPR